MKKRWLGVAGLILMCLLPGCGQTAEDAAAFGEESADGTPQQTQEEEEDEGGMLGKLKKMMGSRVVNADTYIL